MTDLVFDRIGDGTYDFEIVDGDFKIAQGFESAIIVSLLTDARADESRVPDPDHNRGWLANIESPVQGRQLGSVLWVTDQARLNQSTLTESISFARKALQWFVDDGLAKSISVYGQIVPKKGIELEIIINPSTGSSQTYNIKLWELTSYGP